MWFRQVSDNDCIRFTVWIAVMITLASLFSISTGVLGQNTKMVFDETKDVERVKVTSGDNSERMIGAASDINRKHSSRVKLFDDIFNVNLIDVTFTVVSNRIFILY